MQIIEVIDRLKGYYLGSESGKKIQEETTRDKILYGDANVECTGIVTTCFASVDVIKKAAQSGANLIIVHEALFWNHGDHTDWLVQSKNKTFELKKKLLDETGIVVWRNHDYIHTGLNVNGTWVDGIFYGFMKVMGWEDYLVSDVSIPMIFSRPNTTVQEIAEELIEKLRLNGLRIVGDAQTKINRIMIPMHLAGQGDNKWIEIIDSENIDLILSMEIVDYTVSEYMRDSFMLSQPKAIINVGHFNLEEPGMEFLASYVNDAIGCDIPCHYIQSGDAFNYIQ